MGVHVWLAFAGAAIATVLVYGIASLGREGATPVKLALAGAAVTAGLTSLTTAIVLTDVEAFDELRFWQVGALAGRYLPVFLQTAPFIAVGAVVALLSGRALNGLALGEDVAIALGQRVRRTRFVLFATVAILCGAATAACGPIVFVGLVVPHLARALCGPDYRWILPYAAVLTPIVLLTADIIGRIVMAPGGAAGRGRARRPRRSGVHRPGPRQGPGGAVTMDQVLAPPAGSQMSAAVRHAVDRDRATRRRRAAIVTAALLGLVAALLVTTMMVGSYALGPWEVLASLLRLRDDSAVDFVVLELRLPTAMTGLLVGTALGVAGITFQTLLRNPLASPDFVGVPPAPACSRSAAIMLVQVGSFGVSIAALIGALVSCALVYVLAWRGGIVGYRFILIGIGISELMFSLVGYLLARAEIWDAREAMTWLVGSLGQAGTGELVALGLAVVVLVPIALLLDRPLRALELGDDAATASGARVEWSRLALIGVSVVLVAFAVAAAGPILFVALIAGPIAARLLGPTRRSLIAAGLVGAALVLAADLVAEHLLPVALPTGCRDGAHRRAVPRLAAGHDEPIRSGRLSR